MNKKELANLLGISVAYLCQIESGKRSNPKTEILSRIVYYLQLNEEEKDTLYNLYSSENQTVCPDISEYIIQNPIVPKAIRKAIKNKADDQDWQDFIDRLEK